jgi:hypothetical protein
VLIRHTLALYLECARNVVDKLVSVFGYSMQYRFREILESAAKIKHGRVLASYCASCVAVGPPILC